MSATAEQTEVTLAVVNGRIVMVLADPAVRLGVAMDPREADRLAGRLRKAASDVRAAKARS